MKTKIKNRKVGKQFLSKMIMGLILVSLTVGCNTDDTAKSTGKLWLAGGLLSEIANPNVSSQTYGQAQVSISVADTELDVATVTVTISGLGIITPIVNKLTKVGDKWQTVISEIPIGKERIFTGQAYDAAGTLLYHGFASDVSITVSQVTDIFIMLQDINSRKPGSTDNIPVIDSIVVSTLQVLTSGTANFSVTAHNTNSRYTLSYLWTATSGSFNTVSSTSTTWRAPTIRGSYTINIKVTNSKGSATSVSFVMNVSSNTGSGSIAANFNTWPVVERITVTDCCLISGASMNLTLVASDIDGDLISYLWSSSCGIFDNATAQNPMFTATATTAGDCRVTVKIEDGRGGVNFGSVTIWVKPLVAP